MNSIKDYYYRHYAVIEVEGNPYSECEDDNEAMELARKYSLLFPGYVCRAEKSKQVRGEPFGYFEPELAETLQRFKDGDSLAVISLP